MLPAILVLLLATTCISNAAEDSTQPTKSPSVDYDLEVVNGQLLHTPNRPEATLANVVDILRARYEHANIVVAPGLGELKIADLKLRAGQLMDELEAIRVASGDKFEILLPRGGGGPAPAIDPNTGLQVTGQMESNSGLFVLQQPAPTPQTERIVEAFNIESYLVWLRRNAPTNEIPPQREEREQKSIDQLTQIVRETIGILKNQPRPDIPVFQFHRGASLLVTIGPRESVEVTRKIVDALPGMGSPQRTDAGGQNAAAMEAFRRRYGLAPGSQDPNATAPPAPAQK